MCKEEEKKLHGVEQDRVEAEVRLAELLKQCNEATKRLSDEERQIAHARSRREAEKLNFDWLVPLGK